MGSNIELGEGVFFPQRRRLEIVLLLRKVDMMGKTFSSSFVRDCSTISGDLAQKSIHAMCTVNFL